MQLCIILSVSILCWYKLPMNWMLPSALRRACNGMEFQEAIHELASVCEIGNRKDSAMLVVSVIMLTPSPAGYSMQCKPRLRAITPVCLQITYDNKIMYKRLKTGRQTPHFHQHLPHKKHILLQAHFPVHQEHTHEGS